MELLWKDIRFSIHSLRANPGFALVAILTLALGIGATTAIFSVVNGVLLQPLPLHDPGRLVMMLEKRVGEPLPRGYGSASPANYNEWIKEKRLFAGIGAFFDWEMSLTGQGEPELIRGCWTATTLMPTLGVKPYLGRTLQVDDETTAVLSHALWKRKFGGDPKVIGRTVTVDGSAFTVVGIMPPDFFIPDSRAELWLPFVPPPDVRGRYLRTIARLAPGITLEQAQAGMDVVAARTRAAAPRNNANMGVLVVPLHEQVVGDVRRTLLIVLAAVAALLLIGCVNVANLLLSRATSRSREMAVRAALGASRWQLMRQLLTESLILAAIAGILGVVIAGWATMLLVRFTPESALLPRLSEVAVDGRVLAITALITLATGVVFGLAPAIQASRTDLQTGLKSGSRGSTHDRRGKVFRNALVVIEVALATVLLIGAGLLIKSFAKLEAIDPGVRRDGVLTMRVVLPETYRDPARRQTLISQMLERIATVPGVERVGATMTMPFTPAIMNQGFTIEGAPTPPAGEEPSADIRPIAGDFFRAMGMPMIAGRTLNERITTPDRVEFVVNEEFQRRYFPGQSAIGRRVNMEWFTDYKATIVGVVGTVPSAGLGTEPAPAIYMSYLIDPNTQFTLAIPAKGDPMSLQVPVAKVIRQLEPRMPIDDVATLDDLISGTIARPRFNATMLTLFAALGLILASIGIYGVLSYSVAQRTQEMGIRMALGADPGDVRRLVVRDGMSLALLGVAAGVLAALPATRVLAALLYGVDAIDPAVFFSVALTLVAVALMASYIPARRATRVDPMIALRPE